VSKHAAISPGEAADRLAIRELVEAYAYCADRRDAKGQMSQSLLNEGDNFRSASSIRSRIARNG
jgi:hypothetical protein